MAKRLNAYRQPLKLVYLGAYFGPLQEWLKIGELQLVACTKHNTGAPQLEAFCKGKNIPFALFNSKTDMIEKMASLETADYCLVSGFGYRLTMPIIEKFKKVYNIHPGNLQNNRGGSPVQQAILNREKELCVQLHEINSEELDCGPLVFKASTQFDYSKNISINDTYANFIAAGLTQMLANFLAWNIEVPSLPWTPGPDSYKPLVSAETTQKMVAAKSLNEYLDTLDD